MAIIYAIGWRKSRNLLSNSAAVASQCRTNDFDGAVLVRLCSIYRPGFKMAKAGVMLLELQSDAVQQQELALEDDNVTDRGRLMTTLDDLNQRYGRGTVLMASAGLAGNRRAWSMKQERRTPGYTTCWEDMAVAASTEDVGESNERRVPSFGSTALLDRRYGSSLVSGWPIHIDSAAALMARGSS